MAIGTLTLAWLLMAPGAPPSDVFHMNSPNFSIPIKTDPSRRAEMKELRLFESRDQGATWNDVAVGSPDQKEFKYHAPADGTYWFSVQIVDNQGNKQPPDIYKVPPAQKIVVDTLKPTLRIVSAERQGEEVAVAWESSDDNLNLDSMKLEYRAADAGETGLWYSAALSPAPIGQTRVKLPGATGFAVRMQVQDYAGNQAMDTRNVPAVVASAAAPPPSSPRMTPSVDQFAANPAPPPSRLPGLPEERPITGHDDPWSRNTSAPPAPPPPPAFGQPGSPAFVPPAPAVGQAPRVIAAAGVPSAVAPSGVSPVGYSPTGGSMPPLLVTNKKPFALEYDVTDDGPSKLRSVDLYMTRDGGQNWSHCCNDPDLKSPILVDLPGDGVYGLRLMLTSGAGLTLGPPQPGELPELLVEIDRTPPAVQLFEPQLDPQRPNILVITWTASDRNLAPNPITLEWADQPSGPWNPIGGPALANSSRFDWQLPGTMPAEVYLRILVRDTAGNVTEAVTRTKILIDLHKPKAILKPQILSPAPLQ